MTDQPNHRSLVVPAVVSAVAIALIVLVLTLASGGKEAPTADDLTPPAQGGVSGQAPTAVENPDEPDLTVVERHDPDDPLAAGEVDAPVTLVVFSDYQCPFCASWNAHTLPELMPYVQAGDLRIEWRDVNVFGPDSVRASQAAYAAGLQEEFWTYHDELFAGGEPRSTADLSREALVGLAEQIGLDVQQFRDDLDSERTAAAVTENAELGHSLGVYSTPAFLLGGEPILGAQPTPTFVAAYERALAEAP